MLSYVSCKKQMKSEGVKKMSKYPRNMHGGELWAKIEILENVSSPLF